MIKNLVEEKKKFATLETLVNAVKLAIECRFQ
jgi:hypothetical protein